MSALEYCGIKIDIRNSENHNETLAYRQTGASQNGWFGCRAESLSIPPEICVVVAIFYLD